MRASRTGTAASLFLLFAACASEPTSRFGSLDPNNPANMADTGPSFNNGDQDGGSICVPSAKNFDVPGNGCDDDGDGQTDNAPSCDGSLNLGGDAIAFAKALGICRSASDGGWGLISASYLSGYQATTAPAAGQHGILTKFGNSLKPREGKALGVLSSGWAREYNNSNGTSGTCFNNSAAMSTGYVTAPPGFPKPAKGCPGANDVYDMIVLRLKLRTPNNAKGLAFDFNFLSGEWPMYVCSTFNDSFIAMLTSKAFNNGKADNISFDPQKNPVSVNNGFFDRCSAQHASCGKAPGVTSVCASGDSELRGTGFYCPGNHCGNGTDSGGGGTGWLQTTAPVQAGEEITLDFMIWDTGDRNLDSSVLLDNFKWVEGETTTVTDRPR